jgi:putative FmdB family regulatory protein
MPLYDFQCTCGHRFEGLARFGQESARCPKCGRPAQRQHNPAAPTIFFKGPGFYTTDQKLASLPGRLREEQQ